MLEWTVSKLYGTIDQSIFAHSLQYYNNNVFNLEQPYTHKFNANDNLGGGLAFLVKDCHTIVSITPADHTSFEALAINIKLPSDNLVVY